MFEICTMFCPHFFGVLLVVMLLMTELRTGARLPAAGCSTPKKTRTRLKKYQVIAQHTFVISIQ